jgi:hypothetical protein
LGIFTCIEVIPDTTLKTLKVYCRCQECDWGHATG